jgi:hypothetical protein
MKKGKEFIFITVLSALLFPALTFASYPAIQYPDVPPIERMHQNGGFTVYVEQQGKWREVGKITYDEFFRERAIDLGRYLSGDEEIRIRLVQKGGEAAHIDSVFLGNRPPLEVIAVARGTAKLSKKDFDVIDVFGKSVDVVFNKNIRDKTLKLTARVEATNKGIPFQFPLDNLRRKMDANAHFYHYMLNSRKGDMKLDGHLGEVSGQLPFFRKYSLSVTGHPSNYTYGWVWNDNRNLYVAMDFTPDDTMDGDKDYAKVYINTGRGVKEFRVSVPERRWGRPGFTYTNRVPYQHKVYEFKIPLREIGKENVHDNDEILLAFSAYGTAATTAGACCYGDGTSLCTPADVFTCEQLSGRYQGDDVPCASAGCGPGRYIYSALIDSVPGGGDVEVVQKGESPHSIHGIDYIVRIDFDGQTGQFLQTHIDQYQGGSGFVTIQSEPSTHSIGYGNGYHNASVVEFRGLKSMLGNPENMKIIYHASREYLNDYTDPFQFPSHSSVPSLTQWGMIILSLLLAGIALLVLWKRDSATVRLISILLIVLSLTGIVSANFLCPDKICLDGLIEDWAEIAASRSVTDPAGDSSANDSFEDIFAGYITSDDTYFYFRMDVDVPIHS